MEVGIITRLIMLIIGFVIICVSIWGCSLLIGDIRYSTQIMIFVIASGMIAGYGWFRTGTLSPYIGAVGTLLVLVAMILSVVGLFMVGWKFFLGVHFLITIGIITGKSRPIGL